jgi:hypothetical protein
MCQCIRRCILIGAAPFSDIKEPQFFFISHGLSAVCHWIDGIPNSSMGFTLKSRDPPAHPLVTAFEGHIIVIGPCSAKLKLTHAERMERGLQKLLERMARVRKRRQEMVKRETPKKPR